MKIDTVGSGPQVDRQCGKHHVKMQTKEEHCMKIQTHTGKTSQGSTDTQRSPPFEDGYSAKTSQLLQR